MPKFQLLSDLHLEFYPNFESEILPKLKTDADYLILAGDICEARNFERFSWFFRWCSENYKQTVYVFGNHEFYNCYEGKKPYKPNVYQHFSNLLSLLKASNLYRLYEFYSLIINENISIMGDTTWTDYDDNNPLVMIDCERMTNDKKAGNLIAEVCRDNHLRVMNNLKQTLASKKDKNIILVTHHAITRQGTPEQFKNNKLNGGFCSDYDQLIIHNPEIKVVCSGHQHNNWHGKIGMTDYYINPLGYPSESQNKEYTPLTFEI